MALPRDAHAVGNLARQFAAYLRGLGDNTDFNLTAETYLRDGFESRPVFSGIVAESDCAVIGYLLYHFGYDSDIAAPTLHVADLYVDANARNKGVGRSLMATVARIAREAEAREMIWSVYHANQLATSFYEKLGAERIRDVFFMKLRVDAL